MQTVHVHITGRVQGVGYRAWAVEHATLAKLTGWVRNRSDGSVEVMLQGDRQAIKKFLNQCNDGPRFAKVVSVIVGNVENSDEFQEFTPKTTL